MILQSLKARIIAGFILILVLLVLVGVYAFRQIDTLVDHASWVEHTHEVIALINEIHAHIVHAETGQRGYLLTGDEQYLTYFTYESHTINDDFYELYQFTVNVPQMQILTDSLFNLTEQKLAELNETIVLRRDSGFAAALDIVLTHAGRDITEDIHAVFNEMISIENELLLQRKLTEVEGIDDVKRTIFIISLFAVAVTLMVILMMIFRFVLPINRLTSMASEIAEGDLSVRSKIKSTDEIGILSQAINRMTDSLVEANVVLEQEIDDRKADQAQLRIAYIEMKKSRLAMLSISEDLSLEVIERKRLQEIRDNLIADLKRSNRDLEQFAYVASHDLQEPLRMVSSFTQLLAERYRDQLDEEAGEFIEFAVDGANRMQKQIRDLLEYSRIGSRGNPIEPVDSHSALGEVISDLSRLINENCALISNDDLPFVMADRSQLITLFQNLIGNSIKFHGEESPRVHISAEKDDLDIQFSVRDNGIGIDKEYFDRIFTIFQRLHTKADYPGTGIGLAICERIVTRHGGRIWVESESGKGSVFHFTLKGVGEVKNDSY